KSPIKDDKLSIRDVTKIRDRLIDDLNNLIRCFELYLIDYVGGIEIATLSPDVYDLKVDKVLSFNYTSTYSNLYEVKNDEIEYDYIHGKAKHLNTPPNNMVLGIDEYLQDNSKDSNIMFIEFKKYFQRIHKSTGSIYKKWIENSEETYNVYFFGHSLNVTDKDVLRDIILCDKAHVTIYYHSSEQYASQIKNLVQVLSQEKLISMVYGKNPKIKFKCQQEKITKKQAGWQIMRDILILEQWHNANDNELDLIDNRIKQAIESNDINYFYSQQKIISLYDALMSYEKGFAKYKSKLLEIACGLFKPDRYDLNVWKKDFQEETNNPFTLDLIEEINEFNIRQRLLEELQFDDLEYLKVQLKEREFSEERITEITKKLFSMFSDCNNVPLLWECIYIVREKFNFEQWEAFIENTIKQSSDIEKKRYKYLKSEIEKKWRAKKKIG
ncbi:MAG: bacteriophage abortive infection AbiH family protein, partial [Oscillospiraceae bacterium]|nr:bacteriophage abortive infection AbiH family protein [Oscillospiraceae bacterium]